MAAAPTLEEVGRALSAADAAGAADDARQLARLYQKMQGDSDMQRMANPATGMSTSDLAWSGAGKAVNDLIQGGKQLYAKAADAVSPRAPTVAGLPQTREAEAQQAVDESRKLDAPLMKTKAGQLGNLGGNLGVAVPAMFVPGANTYAGAAVTGGLLGALQPTAGTESRGINTGAGLLTGLAGQGVGNAVGRFIKPVQSALPPQEQALAQAAAARGIPLTPGQATGSKPLQIAESVMENLPFTSGPQIAQKAAQKEAFTKAVGSTFGAPEAALTPDVMGTARKKIGDKFTELSNRNTLNTSDDLVTKLGKIQDEALKYETGDTSRIISNRIDEFLGKVDTNGQVPGEAYRKFDSALGRTMRGTTNGDLRNALGDIRATVREAMDSSISSADQSAWKDARREYANLMTVAPIAAKSEVGDVSGRTLLSAANRSSSNAKFGAPSDLAELGRIGKAFIADQIPDSGTAQRTAMQSLLTGGAGSGIGAISAGASGHDPVEGAMMGAGITAGGLLAPRALQMAMNSPAGRAYLTKGLLNLTPQQLALINAASRGGAVGLLGNAKQ